MNAHELEQGTVTTLELKPEAAEDFGRAFSVHDNAELQFIDGTDGACLRVASEQWNVVGTNQHQRILLDALRETKPAMLCWIAAVHPKMDKAQRMTLQVHVFVAKHTWADEVDIGIDDEILRLARRRVNEVKDIDSLREYLEDKFLVPVLDSPHVFRAVISASPNHELSPQNPFRFHGRGLALDVVINREGKLVAKKLVEAKSNRATSEKRPIILAEGKLRFCDTTFAGVIRGTAGVELEQIAKEEGSYFQVWQAYHHREREKVMRRAREFGWLHYRNCEYLGDNKWRFFLSAGQGTGQVLRFLAEGEELQMEADKAVPPELSESTEASSGGVSAIAVNRPRRFMGGCVHEGRSGESLDIKTWHDGYVRPPGEGYLFVSLTGDQRRLDRREHAKASIWSMENGMPTLAWLLERRVTKSRSVKTYKALSEAAKASFKYEPNERQKEALSIALNTPDIAVIQGPPGTGKTEVIAALQARLAEIEGENRDSCGHILLTSYQHDAVEYAVSRTRVYGLPAIKIGRRWGSVENKDQIESWRNSQLEKIRASLKHVNELPINTVLKRVRYLAAAYSVSPSLTDDPVLFLDKVLDLARPYLNARLTDRLLRLKHDLIAGRAAKAHESEFPQALSAVRAIRTSPVEFSDDGPITARKALRWLKAFDMLEPAQEELLDKASSWNSSDEPPFLRDLDSLRGRVLDRLLPDNRPAGSPLVNQDVADLLSDIVGMLDGKIRTSLPGVDAVLYEYLDDLEHAPQEVKRALVNYTAVLAATCSQAAGYRLSEIKGDFNKFQSVLVDEAARANPLDLCIPLALAQRRIVLVGDHRQLPHMLEPDIEHDLQTSVSDGIARNLRESLFQRLFESLHSQEQHDGIKRTITLNVQYRMHPVLGRFISRTFYEPFGEGFESGLPAASFTHGLPQYTHSSREVVAAWMNIPKSKGPETTGRSKSRPSEARWAANATLDIFKAQPNLSIGVVSFYAAQVAEILRQMVPLGLAEEGEDGLPAVKDEWRRKLLSDGRVEDRLCVGTVDAFQGKQFDVVILSMTRSNSFPDVGEMACRRKYGHLMFPNRCCVAMSRQKRLLIVVGDLAMLETQVATQVVPSLVAFRDLCKSPYGIILQ